MTVRERMMACYRHESVDGPVCAIYSRYLNRGAAERQVRNSGMGIIDYVPPVTMMAPPWHMLDGFLSPVEGAQIQVKYSWSQGRMIERRCFDTPAGELYTDIEQDNAGIGSEHIVRHYIEEAADYDAMLYVARNCHFYSNFDMTRSHIDNLGDDGVVLGRLDRSPFQRLLIELCNPEKLFIDLFDAPERIEELLDLLALRQLEAAELAMKSPIEVFWLPDNVTAEMTSPTLFRKYCVPYYKNLIDIVHGSGKILLAHFDGKLRPLQRDIVSVGFDGIESMSLPEMNGDMSLSDAQRIFAPAAILPNFPANMYLATDSELASWLDRLMCEADGNPLMIQISEDLPPQHTARVALELARAINERR